jgi:hypothetical protein
MWRRRRETGRVGVRTGERLGGADVSTPCTRCIGKGGESEQARIYAVLCIVLDQEGATHRIFAISRVTGAAYLVAL